MRYIWAMLRHALILTAALLGACSAPEAEDARRAWLVDALVQTGIPLHGITVLVATGLHRPNEGAELAELVA